MAASSPSPSHKLLQTFNCCWFWTNCFWIVLNSLPWLSGSGECRIVGVNTSFLTLRDDIQSVLKQRICQQPRQGKGAFHANQGSDYRTCPSLIREQQRWWCTSFSAHLSLGWTSLLRLSVICENSWLATIVSCMLQIRVSVQHHNTGWFYLWKYRQVKRTKQYKLTSLRFSGRPQ